MVRLESETAWTNIACRRRLGRSYCGHASKFLKLNCVRCEVLAFIKTWKPSEQIDMKVVSE